jgi:SAM-dependent methyltransferase
VIDIGGGQRGVKDRVGSWRVQDYRVLDNDVSFDPDIFADLNYIWENIKWDKVDVVFCLEVMEYVFDPVTAHKNIYNLLKPKGVAYISYQTLYPLHRPYGLDYLRYTKNAVEKLLGESGFKTWEITPRVTTQGLRSLRDFYSYERMRPIKGEPEVFHTGYMVKCFKGNHGKKDKKKA